ncbi:MAG: AAA family ATPase [Candidatus Nanoarchaeia archaeon]
MANNLFFLCGPHGSGKTTLANELSKLEEVLVPELYSRNIKLDTAPQDRLILKICQRSLENFEYLQIARKNPDKIVLGNRCIYDQLVYNELYAKKGWINKKETERYNIFSENFYINGLRNPFAIVLNPGFEVCLNHLKKRWSKKGKKWREEDLEYDRLACEGFEKYRNQDNIFYIDHEIDLTSKNDINVVYEWMRDIKGEILVENFCS